MGFRPIYGHEALLNRLGGTLASGRFPQAALFVGPAGVGKQRLALWVAQGLLCSAAPGVPCGTCDPCRRVDKLSHPDLHWIIPILRPKAGDPGKQLEEARELLAEAVAERRREPLYNQPDRMASHALASVRLVRQVVSMTPFLGSRKVVILGDAERLIVQESSPEAANALLKVLEEPPADTTLVLTAADPEALLPTIRSRLIPLRVGRVSDDAVRQFLQRELAPPPGRAAVERRTVLAEGCVGRALWQADDARVEEAVGRLLAAVKAGPRGWTMPALAQVPWSARGDFSALLDGLAVELRSRLRDATSGNREELGRLIDAVQRVESTRADAQGNVNPQLALAVLGRDLERLL